MSKDLPITAPGEYQRKPINADPPMVLEGEPDPRTREPWQPDPEGTADVYLQRRTQSSPQEYRDPPIAWGPARPDEGGLPFKLDR